MHFLQKENSVKEYTLFIKHFAPPLIALLLNGREKKRMTFDLIDILHRR